MRDEVEKGQVRKGKGQRRGGGVADHGGLETRLCITVPEAAAMLGISRNLAYELAKRGELPGIIKLGQKRLVVSKLAIQRLLQGEDSQKGSGE